MDNSLFDNRKIVAAKLLASIRDAGYTKVSFCKKTGISRPTLDKILNNEVTNKVSYDKHMGKILGALEMSEQDLLHYAVLPPEIEVVYSKNAPEDRVMSDKALKEYDLLLDLVELAAIYI